ncbi:EamA family transporter [Sedimentitalea sp. CY04]|uniref:EamA family transporter n=1 Tax=Parasedimentitalea denitrificans TaxID=2211118 RepID=A0ABX0W9M4_9RHOB|nr:DMT family transporter [Sedimentitalea sp. CY04]NIZ61489.1 EamA family transporter [Sedimentitalea sp. CY04]
MTEITGRHWLMIAVLGLTWGGTFMVVEIALRGITPFWLAAARIGLGALVTSTIWQLRGGKLFAQRPTGSHIRTLAVIGVFSSAMPFMLLNWGQQYVTSGFAGVSMASVALFVLPLAHFFVPGEHLTWRRTLGFLIGFVGVSILIGGQALSSSGAEMELAGRIACMAAACCYACSVILMRRLPAVNAIGLAAVLLLIGSLVAIPVALIVEGPPPALDGETLIATLVLALIPTAGANMLRVAVVRSAGPVFATLVSYQVPLWSVLLGTLFLAEPLPSTLLWALGLILCGMGLSQYGPLMRLFGRRSNAAQQGSPQT